MKDFTPTSYTLECVATGREFPDEGWTLDDAQCKCPSLIRTRYAKKQLELKSDEYGFYKAACSANAGKLEGSGDLQK